MEENKYTITATSNPGSKLFDTEFILMDEQNTPVIKGKYDAKSTAGALLAGLSLGGMLNFKLFDKSDALIGSTHVSVGIGKKFEVYDEAPHALKFKVTIPFSFTRGLAISDANDNELWRIESGTGPTGFGMWGPILGGGQLVSKIYKSPDHVEVGTFVLDFKTHVHTVNISDKDFPPMLVLAVYLIASNDTSSRDGSVLI